MGVHWKTKQALRTQLGKACLTHQCGNLSPTIQAVTEEVVCPSGEQITNGGFETGDFTGWSHDEYNYAKVVTENPYAGTYHCRIDGAGWIQQDLLKVVPQECLTATSVFGYYYCCERPPHYGTLTTQWRVTLTYTDETTTTIDYSETWGVDGAFTPYSFEDLKTYVEAGKTLKTIKFERTGGEEIRIDEVTCNV